MAINFALALAMGVATAPAYAADARDLPTIAATFAYGPTTYKSELVTSNDTSFSMSYDIQVLAGEEKNLGIGIRNDSNTTAFELNTSAITTAWMDTVITYNLSWAYLGVVISNVAMTANKENTDLFELSGQGYGGNLGCNFDFGRGGTFKLDVASVAISKVTEINQTEVSFGSRMDIDIGATFDITRRLLDFAFGYKQRTVPITFSGTAGTETITTTYLGLRLAAEF